MAPISPRWGIGIIPNNLMAEYYAQRSGAGLIITEGITSISDVMGYPKIPWLFGNEQIDTWKRTISAVHKEGSKIFLQLIHTGLIEHSNNLLSGAVIRSMFGMENKKQIFNNNRASTCYNETLVLTIEGIENIMNEYVTVAKNAILSGFDGIEVCAANGYLPEQFLNPRINNRQDAYGGCIINRAKFLLEIVEKTTAVIGKTKIGVRISPFSIVRDMRPQNENDVNKLYKYIAMELSKMDIAYLHMNTNPHISKHLFDRIRSTFSGTIILSNNHTPETAEDALYENFADLVTFNPAHYTTLYTPGNEEDKNNLLF